MMINQDDNSSKQQKYIATSSDYYSYFDQRTNGGKVLDQDLSATAVIPEELSKLEEDARHAYIITVKELTVEYDNGGYNHPVATTKEEVLQQRIVAPCLQSHDTYEIFNRSLNRATTECGDEKSEERSLVLNLDQTLRKSGIVEDISYSSSHGVGQTDFCVINHKKDISVIVECKSTHNLLLPMHAHECATAYNRSFEHEQNNGSRSIEWSNVVHPIVQLLGYMVDNEHRYGALTSGTRTYFVCLTSHTDGQILNSNANAAAAVTRSTVCTGSQGKMNHRKYNGMKVYISDAWFVGEENYLRAWAYMHQLQESMEPWNQPANWLQSISSIDAPELCVPKKRKHLIESSREKNKTSRRDSHNNDGITGTSSDEAVANSLNVECFYPIHQGALDFVQFSNIVIMDTLGSGRNGACFRVKWNGNEFAMKQFDIGRDGDEFFKKEICAYMLLQIVWGILVPRPIFVSESFSGGIMFLGMQLGREPTMGEKFDFDDVIQRLENDFGIRHNDVERERNCIVISGTDGVDRIAAIDFEDWDYVKRTLVGE